jgi:hypothetical protein
LAYFHPDAVVVVRRILKPLVRNDSGAVARTLLCQKVWTCERTIQNAIAKSFTCSFTMKFDVFLFFKKFLDILQICKDAEIFVRIIQSRPVVIVMRRSERAK